MTAKPVTTQHLTDQRAFRSLSEAYASGAKRVVYLLGAGPSRDAGLPDWPSLIAKLRTELMSPPLSDIDPASLPTRMKTIDDESSPWRKLTLIRNYMTPPLFEGAIKEALSTKKLKTPEIFGQIWQTKPDGILTTNLDPFASEGFDQLKTGKRLEEADGRSAPSHLSIVQIESPFCVNLHGTLDRPESWILTEEDLATLSTNEAYINFLRLVFAHAIVIFYGISADEGSIYVTYPGASNQGAAVLCVGLASSVSRFARSARISVGFVRHIKSRTYPTANGKGTWDDSTAA